MQINLRQVLQKPVVTESGTKLGRVSDVFISLETHAIMAYEVRARLIGGKVFLIKPVQVKEITKDKLIVDDSVVEDTAADLAAEQGSAGAWAAPCRALTNNMALASSEHIKQVEALQQNEQRERQPSFQEKEAAFLNVFGNWKTFIGQDEISVRPLTSKDISWLAGTIAKVVQEKEDFVQQKLAGTEVNSSEEVIAKKGEPARQAILSTEAAVQGEVEFLNKLYSAIFDGLQSKTPEIFVVAPNQVAQYMVYRHQSETMGDEVDPTLTDTDESTNGAQCCYVLTPSKGREIEQVFKDNGQVVKELETAQGFQARLGGVRLIFFYSMMHEPENKEAWVKETGSKPSA